MLHTERRTCDVCRKRKIRCDPGPSQETGSSSNNADQPYGACANCVRLGIGCTYNHVYQRRGRVRRVGGPDDRMRTSIGSSNTSPTRGIDGERESSSRSIQSQMPHPERAQPPISPRQSSMSSLHGKERAIEPRPMVSVVPQTMPPPISTHSIERDTSNLAISGLPMQQQSRPQSQSGPIAQQQQHPQFPIPIPSHPLREPAASLSPLAQDPPSIGFFNFSGTTPLLDMLYGHGPVEFEQAFAAGGMDGVDAIMGDIGDTNGMAGSSGTGMGTGMQGVGVGQSSNLAANDSMLGNWYRALPLPGNLNEREYDPSAEGSGTATGAASGSGMAANIGDDLSMSIDRMVQPGSGGHDPIQLPVSLSIEPSPTYQSIRSLSTDARVPPTSLSGSSLLRSALRQPDIAVEDVGPWPIMQSLLDIYLRYHHSLFPLVHIPTFRRAMESRLDRRSKRFQSFLFGLIAYTIGQSPLERILRVASRQELEVLQHDCYRASMAIFDRDYDRPSLEQVGTLITGYFYCASVAKANNAAALLAEACQLCKILKLPNDPYPRPAQMHTIEIELRRRVFWHVYAVSITEAATGLPIHFDLAEGFSKLPIEVDDEYLLENGLAMRNTDLPSRLSGFNNCVKLFPVMGQCMARHRRFLGRSTTGEHFDVQTELYRINAAKQQVDDIVRALPPHLAVNWDGRGFNDEDNAVYGMQRANILITALSVKFALYDYEAALSDRGRNVIMERDTSSREVYDILAGIPYNDLAANGESMRGKVFRILLALMPSGDESGELAVTLQRWWDMYSMFESIQLVPRSLQTAAQTREASPANR